MGPDQAQSLSVHAVVIVLTHMIMSSAVVLLEAPGYIYEEQGFQQTQVVLVVRPDLFVPGFINQTELWPMCRRKR